jgi:ubiquinone/menaquinone biosynthesis C-methylase UbiE
MFDRDLFFRTLAPVPGERILDVGAGKGSVAHRVFEESSGADVYAVDPNEKRVKSMRSHYPELKSSVAGAESLPFPDSFFDKVYCTMALHHFSDLERALKELKRVLKPGGSFVIVEVDPSSAMGRLFRFFGRLNGEHMNLMTENQLQSKLQAEGRFRVASSAKLRSGYIIQATRSEPLVSSSGPAEEPWEPEYGQDQYPQDDSDRQRAEVDAPKDRKIR